MSPQATGGPHQGQPVLRAGRPLDQARAAVIAIHGRGAGARDILALSSELDRAGLAYLAPQAAGGSWYPYSFLAPLEGNEPYLSSALHALSAVLDLVQTSGIPPARVVVLGFSQGACLGLEFAARNAERYGGLIGFSGGLIGPDRTPRAYAGSLAGTPVFLGCSDIDPHIPRQRVEASAHWLRELGGEVTLRLYPGLGHTVNPDELEFARGILDALEAGTG